VAEAAPRSTDHLCPQCREHFERLTAHLDLFQIPYALNHRLVRGLDYYTRTVFEIQPRNGGAQSTICGGGRYDDLIEELGGRPTPAIGFAIGMERIILNLKAQAVSIPPLPHPGVFIAHRGEKARDEAVRLASYLRQAGTGVIMATGNRSLKAQLRQANNLLVHFTVIIGEEELKSGTVSLRDMTTAAQTKVRVTELPDLLR
jgi:histidyl-tRNA synthetase